ncbi:MAG: hypothetical protein JSV46_01340 [Candidatus Aminicenantes bacterium]|nr:MAG: hypothetical protein JSV46_01340 [Candidatus Aminicenantes bacterium]
MGFQDKMMDKMFEKMSPQEKKEMMNTMMDKFFSSMSDEEKQQMMSEMMQKMMGSGTKGGQNPMMDMMSMMMGRHQGGEGPPWMKMTGKTKQGKKESTGFSPWEMCQRMMSSFPQGGKMSPAAPAEIQELFKEWLSQIEEEILDFIKKNKSVDIDQIAEKYKISKQSAAYLTSKIAEKNRIKVTMKSGNKKE